VNIAGRSTKNYPIHQPFVQLWLLISVSKQFCEKLVVLAIKENISHAQKGDQG